jgi:hypothetical protein
MASTAEIEARPLSSIRRLLRENGLSLVAAGIFAVLLVGQAFTGLWEQNDERREHGQRPIGLATYLTSGHFLEATFENWESEFLQMGFYVVLTVFLFQKGSAESKKLEGKEEVDEDPRKRRHAPDAPWPVRRGGVVLKLYEHSLSLAFLLLFLLAFAGHALSGWRLHADELAQHGRSAASLWEYVTSARFWFESLQNWQSEFLAVAAIVVLSIYLRQRGSPESKPVAAAHAETGG